MKLKKEFIRLKPEQRLYNLKQPLIALTGGIATGKTTVARLFSQNGIKVVNADELVKKIYQESESIDFINRLVPDTVQKGVINFPLLREKVFNNPNLKETIESFIYARLPEAFKNEIASDKNEFIVYDIPLLFERHLESSFDQVIVVYSPREIQLKRLIGRDSNSKDLAEKIINQQIDIEIKRKKANFVINNAGTIQELEMQIQNILNDLFC